MAGVTNSWIQQYTEKPAPCIADTVNSNSSSFSNCVIWLILGMVVGSIAFNDKRRLKS